MQNLRLGWYRHRWAAVWRDPAGGGTRRRSLGTQDRALAEQRLADLRRAAARPRETVAEIYADYLAEIVARGRDPDRAAQAWKALRTPFGHLRPDQIDRPLCRAYASHRYRQGRAPATVAKELALLRRALRLWRADHGAVFELPRLPPPRDRHLSRAEYARLRLAAKTSPHLYLFVVLALATAARKRALLELTWDRVDFARGLIHLAPAAPSAPAPAGPGATKARATVPPTAAKARATVPMTRPARRVLALARPLALSDHVIEYAGRPVADVKKAFAAAAARAGLAGVSPHVLRHTAAVWMAEAGVPMPEIAQYLGHADDRITQRVYARYSPDYLRRAAAALE